MKRQVKAGDEAFHAALQKKNFFSTCSRLRPRSSLSFSSVSTTDRRRAKVTDWQRARNHDYTAPKEAEARYDAE
jgi:hypothetical protein